MKIDLAFFLSLTAASAWAGGALTGSIKATDQTIAAKQNQARAMEDLRKDLRKDFYRVVNGQTNSLLADGWCRFYGKILQTTRDGVRIEGYFANLKTGAQVPGEFFVKHFPWKLPDDSLVGYRDRIFAKEVGTFDYTTVLGANRSIRALDYGIPCPAPEMKPQTNAVAEPKIETNAAASNNP